MSRLSSDDWLALVEIARRAVASAVLEKRLPDFPAFPAALSEPRGAFVSLYCGGALRGCVGQVENPGPLADVVARSAINAALYDSRFPPVSAEEVARMEIEISVLSHPERIQPGAIVAGLHGLMVSRGPSGDFCFRKWPRNGIGPRSDYSRKPVLKPAWRAMPGAIPRRRCLASPRKFFRRRGSEPFPDRDSTGAVHAIRKRGLISYAWK